MEKYFFDAIKKYEDLANKSESQKEIEFFRGKAKGIEEAYYLFKFGLETEAGLNFNKNKKVISELDYDLIMESVKQCNNTFLLSSLDKITQKCETTLNFKITEEVNRAIKEYEKQNDYNNNLDLMRTLIQEEVKIQVNKKKKG
jgi:hypothetical protein